MMLYGIAGACIAGIPLALALVYQCCLNAGLNQQIIDYKEKEKKYLYLSVWTLKEDIDAGEKVTRASLEKRERWVPKADNVDEMLDIKQIAGCRAKIDLKKGVVMQTDLLYEK